TERSTRRGLLRTFLTVAAVGVLTAVLLPTTAGASADAPAADIQRAEAQAAGPAAAAASPQLYPRQATRTDLKRLGIRAPSVCTWSDGEPILWEDSWGIEHGMTCYEAKGDDQWVIDTFGNSKRFYVYSETEYGKKRYCGDNTQGWTECRYNHREHECVIFAAYYRHNNWSGWTPWYSTTTGNPHCVRD